MGNWAGIGTGRGVIPGGDDELLEMQTHDRSRSVALHKNAGLAAQAARPILCPCCGHPVAAPTLTMIIDVYNVPAQEAAILGAVWRGRGQPIQTERIFDAMYADDPDGGPSPSKMYASFKVSLCHLRERLNGSGITIVNVGYRRGYRLVMGQSPEKEN